MTKPWGHPLTRSTVGGSFKVLLLLLLRLGRHLVAFLAPNVSKRALVSAQPSRVVTLPIADSCFTGSSHVVSLTRGDGDGSGMPLGVPGASCVMLMPGVIVLFNGATVVLPFGAVVALPDGGIVILPGVTILPIGGTAVLFEEGMDMLLDSGTVVLPVGSSVVLPGMAVLPGNVVAVLPGKVIAVLPGNGIAVLPDGSTVLCNGSIAALPSAGLRLPVVLPAEGRAPVASGEVTPGTSEAEPALALAPGKGPVVTPTGAGLGKGMPLMGCACAINPAYGQLLRSKSSTKKIVRLLFFMLLLGRRYIVDVARRGPCIWRN